MKVFITGIDGYLGWPLALHLINGGHEVGGMDNFSRRKLVEEMGSYSAIPIVEMYERENAIRKLFGTEISYFKEGDLTDPDIVEQCLRDFKPDAIVHLGENPSAPYSMMGIHCCLDVHRNNLFSTLNILHAMRDICPEAHLIKLGTMGEYGTPNVDIPEGFFDVEYKGRKDHLPFPKQAGSWYHWTKVHDSNNIMFACKIWNLRSTDIMQGVVFGTRTNEIDGQEEQLYTRLDFDQCFGTVINRYCCQAVIEHPLTPYGEGAQKRGFIPLRDSIHCMRLVIENPPEKGKYRVLNQFAKIYDVTDLAIEVEQAARELGLFVPVRNLENPRIEAEEHYYNPERKKLEALGYKPEVNMKEEIEIVLSDLYKYKDRILKKQKLLIPDIRWDGTRRKSEFLVRGGKHGAD